MKFIEPECVCNFLADRFGISDERQVNMMCSETKCKNRKIKEFKGDFRKYFDDQTD